MKPSEKGWLKEYLELRMDSLKEVQLGTIKTAHPEQALYRVIQPTGLMYGQAILSLDYPNSNDWSNKERMKILLAESLISSSFLFYNKQIKSTEELSEVIFSAKEKHRWS